MGSAAQLIAEKLLHPSGDVRARTLQNLEFKLRHGLLTDQDVIEEPRLTQALLRLISLGDGASVTTIALMLCQQLAGSSEKLATQLLQQGALLQAQQLMQEGPAELRPAVNQLLEALQPSGARRTAAAGEAATADVGAGAGPSRPTRLQQEQPTYTSAGAQLPAAAAAAAAAGGTPLSADAGYRAHGAAGEQFMDERLLRAQARADWRQQQDPPGTKPAVGAWLRLPRVPLTAADDQYLFELNVRLQYSDDEALLLPALEELGSIAAADFPAEALLQRQSLLDNVLALLASPRMPPQVHQAASNAVQQLLHGLRRSLALAADPALSDNAVAAAARTAAAMAAAEARGGAAAAAAGLEKAAAAAAAGASAGTGFGSWPAAAAVAGAVTPVTCPSSYPQLQLPAMSPQEAAWQLLPDPVDGCVDVGAVVWRILLQVADLLHATERHWHLLPIVDLALPMALLPLQLASMAQGPAGPTPPASAGRQEASKGLTQQQQARQQAQSEVQAQQLEQVVQQVASQWRALLASLSRALVAALAMARSTRAGAVVSAAGGGQLSEAALAAVAPGTSVLLAGVPAQHGWDGLGSGEEVGTAAWDLPCIHLVQLAVHCMEAAPAGWLGPDSVPRVMADAVLAAALDGAVAQQVPGLRPAALGLLQGLRPHGLLLLEWAEGVRAALQLATQCIAGLPALAAQLQADASSSAGGGGANLVNGLAGAGEWLQLLVGSLAGLGYSRPADAQLLRAAVQGVAACAQAGCAAGDAGADVMQSCVQVMLAVLTHSSSFVQHSAYGLLAAALDAGASSAMPAASAGQPAVEQRVSAAARLVEQPAVLECLVVLGLGQQGTRAAAAEVLQSWLQWALQQPGPLTAALLLQWSGWLACYTQDAAAGPLAQAWVVAVQQQVEQAVPGGWQEAALHVRQLFSSSAGARQAAARQLLQILGLPPSQLASPVGSPKGAAGTKPPSDLQDPFRGLLDPRSHTLDPLTDCEASLAANFTPEDVQKLLRVLLHEGLATELRRSAAEELLPLLVLPELRAELEQEEVLEPLWALVQPRWQDENTAPGGNSAAQDTFEAAASLFDMQLPVAVLQLLTGLLAHSSVVGPWLQQQGDSLLLPTLGLAFHPLTSVRRATARLLSLAVLGWDAQQSSSYVAATGGPLLPLGCTGVLLPEPFLQQYKWPFRTEALEGLGAWVASWVGQLQQCSVAPPGVQLLEQQQAQLEQQQQRQREAEDCWGLGVTGDLGGWSPGGHAMGGSMQVLRAALHNMLAQQRVLQQQQETRGNDHAASPGHADISDVPQTLLAATTANAASLDHPGAAAAALGRVASAHNHRECGAGLQSLLDLTTSAQGIQAVAGAGWQGPLKRLLAAAPVTEEDQQMWLQVLQLVQRLLLACALPEADHVLLEQCVARSATAWLQQPGAAGELLRVPLALARMPGAAPAATLAAAAELAAETGAAAGWAGQLLRMKVSRAVLSLLLVLVRCSQQLCDSRSPAASLAALQPGQLLPLLTQTLLKQAEGTDYYCRLLAVQVLQHVVSALQAAAAAAMPGLPPVSQEHEEVLLGSFEPVITGVVMPAAAKQAQGFRGKGLVRGGLAALLALTDGPLLGPGVWCLAWGAVGGTFWLSRLSRDKEASIRRAAVQLLERCLAPGATSTTTMLLQGWPDALSRLVRVATDPSEAWGVRAAALRFLVAAAAVPQEVCQQAAAAAEAAGAPAAGSHEAGSSAAAAGAGDGGEADGRSSKGLRLPRFGLAGVLQQQQLWEVLPALLGVAAGGGTVSSILNQQQPQQQFLEQPPAEVAAAAAGCCLVALMGDPDGVGHQLLSHGQVVASLQQLVAAGHNAGAAAEELQQQLIQGRSRPCTWLGRRSDQLPAVAAAVKQWQEDGSLRTYLHQLLLLRLGSVPCSSCGMEPLGLVDFTATTTTSSSSSRSRSSSSRRSGTVPLTAALLQQLVDQHTTSTLLAASQALQVLCVPTATPAAGGDLSLPNALVQQLGQLPGLVGQALCSWAHQLHQLGHLWDAKQGKTPRTTPLVAPPPDSAAADRGPPVGVPGPQQLALVTGARVGQWEVLLAGLLQAANGLAALLEPLEGQQLQETLEKVHNAASSCSTTSEEGGCQPQPMGLLVAVAVGLQQLYLQAAASAAASAGTADAGQQQDGEGAQAMQQQQQELPPSVAGGCLVLCGLLSCLLVEEASARLLLADGEYGEEPQLPGSSTPVGAALCRLLLHMLPGSALNIAASGDASQWQSVGDLLQQPLPATALLALRSLLCFSEAAKAAAVQARLHQQLLASCQLLGQVVAADGAIPDPEQRVLMDISNSSGGAAAAKASPGTGGSAAGPVGPRPFQRPGSGPRRSRAEVLTLDGPLQPAGSPPAQGLAGSGQVKQAGPQQQKQQQSHGPRLRWASRMGQAAGGSSSGSPAHSRPGGVAGGGLRSSRDAAASSSGLEPPAAKAAPTPATAAAGAGGSRAATPATSVASAGGAKRAAQAAALKEAESRLLLCLLMVRHLVYKGGPVKEALVSAGLVDVLVGVWPAAVPRPALLQELLLLVSSMVHGCPSFRAAMSQRKGKAGRSSRPKSGSGTGGAAADGGDGPGLLGLMVSVVLDPSAELGLFSAVTRVLLGYSASPEGGAVLGRQERFAAAASKLLSGFLARKEWSRACHMTQVLASVSAHAEGQAVLLDATTAPAILDLAVQVLLSPHAGASTAALLLLRNLCLHSAARGPVLGHPQLLGLLLCASECLLPAPSAAAAPEGAAARGVGGNGGQAGAGPTAAAGGAGPGRPPKALPVWVKYGKPQTADITASVSRLGRGGGGATTGSGGGRSGQPLTGQGLLSSIEGNVCAAVYAVSALWALVYQGESLKAGLRKLPSAVERLAQVQAHASWLASGLSAGPSSDEAQLAAAAAVERCQFSPASINTRQSGEWLQELQDGCEALRELMADG